MRAVPVVYALVLASAAACAELGVVTDGSSVSYGKPNHGVLQDGVKLPDDGPGYTTQALWRERGNRFGTDELVALVRGVSKRVRKKVKDVRLVVADLSSRSGGAAHTFHRSHQSGRDVDLIYYQRDADGKPFEPDSMRVFDGSLAAKDGSGITVDVPRTWLLVKELLTADEAYVQYIFMYQPIAAKLVEYAVSKQEPDWLIARAVKSLTQPGDSAPHNDHLHVRIYCPATDRAFGCVDIGPLELLAEREAERQQIVATIAQALPPPVTDDEDIETATDLWAAQAKQSKVTPPAPAPADTQTAAAATALVAKPPQAGTTAAPAAGVATTLATPTLSLPAAASLGTLLRR